MKGMIQWGYVGPRLFGLLAAAMLIWFGLDPAMRWTMILSGQSITGAKIDVDKLDSSLARCRLSIEGIRVANPNATDRNLLQASSLAVQLDASELLKRRFVVRSGKISGVRFGSLRETTGELEPSASRRRDGSDWTEKGGQLLKSLALTATDGPITANWEVVEVSNELLTAWPIEYEALSRRIDLLRDRIDGLRDLAETGRLESIADVSQVQQAIEQTQQLRGELAELRDEAERLRERIPADQQRLLVAKDHDMQRIERIAKLARLDGPTLSEYLLGPEYADRVQQLVHWIQWGRRYIPARRDVSAPSRMRGELVRFLGAEQKPHLLIKSLSVDGQIDVDGGALMLDGVMRELTTEPGILGKPAVFRFRTHGLAELQVDAIMDRTGETAADRFRVRCPSLPQRDRLLGRPDQLAMSIAPGSLNLDLVINLHGEAISGNLLVSQPAVDIVPYVGERYGGEALAKRLWSTAKSVESLDVMAHLSGTLQAPRWKLNSNLGPQLADGINHALQKEVSHRKEQLMASLDETWTRQHDRLNEQFRQQQAALDDKLALGQSQIDQIKTQLVKELGLPISTDGFDSTIGNLPARLGRSLPSLGSMFQRNE